MQHEAFLTRRYLAVFLPLLPTQRLIRSKGSAPDTPFAMVEKQSGAMRLAACDTAALALGLSAGMALADARARMNRGPYICIYVYMHVYTRTHVHI